MSTSDEPAVRCQRCGRYGGQVAYGWALLCKRCKDSDDSWYDEDSTAATPGLVPLSTR